MTQRMNVLHNIMAISVFMVVTIALVPGCSSDPKRVSIPATANPNEEISALAEEFAAAKENEVDILAPRSYEKARQHYKKAQTAREKDKKSSDILSSLGMAQAYLNRATEHADRVRPSAADILSAREQAISAGAPRMLRKRFEQIEENFSGVAATADRKRSSLDGDKRAELHREYLDIQADTLKVAKLKPVENTIESAKKQGARRWAPRTLAAAEAKYEIASSVIETDRNNTNEIQRSVVAAQQAANKLKNVTAIAQRNRLKESVALELHARQTAASQLTEEMSQAGMLLQQEKESSDRMRTENAALARQKEFNESFAWAQQQFGANEAEVYRQGDQLLIRLKAMNYKPGGAEVSSAAYPILSKVKDVIAKMGAEKIKVEGHTDSTGSRAINEELSQARAEGVASFLSEDRSIGNSQVEAEGVGFDRPVSTNSTPEGRSQNRRVDIILTPGQVPADETTVE